MIRKGKVHVSNVPVYSKIYTWWTDTSFIYRVLYDSDTLCLLGVQNIFVLLVICHLCECRTSLVHVDVSMLQLVA